MNSDLKSEVRQPRELSNRVLGLLAISSMLLSAVSAIPLVFDMPDSLAWTKSLICPEGYHLDVKVWEESDSDHRGRTYTRIDPYCVAKMGRTIAAPPWMPFYFLTLIVGPIMLLCYAGVKLFQQLKVKHKSSWYSRYGKILSVFIIQIGILFAVIAGTIVAVIISTVEDIAIANEPSFISEVLRNPIFGFFKIFVLLFIPTMAIKIFLLFRMRGPK